MNVNRKFMVVYRNNSQKVREIFETARNSDFDREEVRETLSTQYERNYLEWTNSHLVTPENAPLYTTALGIGTATYGCFINNDGFLIGGLLLLGVTSAIVIRKTNSHVRNSIAYKKKVKDARSNIQTKNKRAQVLEEIK